MPAKRAVGWRGGARERSTMAGCDMGVESESTLRRWWCVCVCMSKGRGTVVWFYGSGFRVLVDTHLVERRSTQGLPQRVCLAAILLYCYIHGGGPARNCEELEMCNGTGTWACTWRPHTYTSCLIAPGRARTPYCTTVLYASRGSKTAMGWR
jgi:hypothetical protein